MSLTRYNKQNRLHVEYFTSLKALADEYGEQEVFNLKDMYIHTSKYGEAPVFVIYLKGTHVGVNIPSHMTDTVKEIMSDRDDMNDIYNGKCGFSVRTYTRDDDDRVFYTVVFHDIDEG